MKAIFNSRIVNTNDHLIKTDDRSFCYGDGLFETIVTSTDRFSLIDFHIARLQRGCTIMEMEYPEILTRNYIEQSIEKLASQNNLNGGLKSKLRLWRNQGGLYAPTESSSSFYLQVSTSEPKVFDVLREIGLTKDYKTQFSPISFAKTSNALTYVLAGVEKNKKHFDDIILCDTHGNLAESHIANLFWISDSKIYTPKLSTGCVSGVMRSFILKFLEEQNDAVIEVEAPIETLKEATSIFTTNAAGIRYYQHYNGGTYENPAGRLEKLIKRLQQP
ncbi:aminotransferase class IV [Roseivirga sp.]|uniref:aminotransferase class IV n=1 Tax=Roseivirga sp. TaxID=1964215 RepID=UPI003B8D97F2